MPDASGSVTWLSPASSKTWSADPSSGLFSSHEAPPRELVSGLPVELEKAILRCLQKERDARWPSIAELAGTIAHLGSIEARLSAERIARTLGRAPVEARRPPPRPKAALALFIGAGLAVTAVVGTALVARAYRRAGDVGPVPSAPSALRVEIAADPTSPPEPASPPSASAEAAITSASPRRPSSPVRTNHAAPHAARSASPEGPTPEFGKRD